MGRACFYKWGIYDESLDRRIPASHYLPGVLLYRRGVLMSRHGAGVYAPSPTGWVGGMPYAPWIQAKIREAKAMHGFCLRSRERVKCPRHGTPMGRLDASINSDRGCERCADELTRLLHQFDLEFIRCRVLSPPVGAVTSYGVFSASPSVCGNRDCRREFIARHPKHNYCCAKCYQKAKWMREKARREGRICTTTGTR